MHRTVADKKATAKLAAAWKHVKDTRQQDVDTLVVHIPEVAWADLEAAVNGLIGTEKDDES